MNKELKDVLKQKSNTTQPVDTSMLLVERKLNSLFHIPHHEQEVRKGLHASAIIVAESSFCIREQVLSLLFERNKNESEQFSDGLLRIFKEGNVIHEKWQQMFEAGGIARGIEDRGYSPLFDLYMTPDAIVEINGKLYVVEIKSMNTYAYKHVTTSHPAGTKQCQLYMHFLCIPRGIVLAEDKNTQEFKLIPTTYEPGQAKPYIERLYAIRNAKRRFIKYNKLPEAKCSKMNCKRAQGCPMSDACFNKRRVELPVI